MIEKVPSDPSPPQPHPWRSFAITTIAILLTPRRRRFLFPGYDRGEEENAAVSVLVVGGNRTEQRPLAAQRSLCSSRSEEELLADSLGVVWTGDLVANGARVFVDLIVVSPLRHARVHISFNDQVHINSFDSNTQINERHHNLIKCTQWKKTIFHSKWKLWWVVICLKMRFRLVWVCFWLLLSSMTKAPN